MLSGVNLGAHCEHGISTPSDAICHSVLDTYQCFWQRITETNQHMRSLVESINVTIAISHPQVWRCTSTREIVFKFMCATGANLVLALINCATVSRDHDSWDKTLKISFLVSILEGYDEANGDLSVALTGKGISNKGAVASYMKMIGGGTRELVKFYKKRLPCHCLKEIYVDMKASMPKTSMCYRCHDIIERSNIQVCGGCKKAQYCSRRCQVSAWQMGHKRGCGKIASTDANAKTD